MWSCEGYENVKMTEGLSRVDMLVVSEGEYVNEVSNNGSASCQG